MGDFLNVFSSKLSLELTEPQICSQKKTMNQTRFDPTLNTSFTTKIDINFPIRAINPQVSNIKHSLVFSEFF